MMLTNLYTSPDTMVNITGKNGYYGLSKCSPLTPGTEHYVAFRVAVEGDGSVTVTFGGVSKTCAADSTTFACRYTPSTPIPQVNVQPATGSPPVRLADITVCAGYDATKQVLDALGLVFFTGDTMPLADPSGGGAA